MCAKARPPVIRSVQTPDALAALRTWLEDGERATLLAETQAVEALQLAHGGLARRAVDPLQLAL